MTFVGLDLRKRYVTACAPDAGGGVSAEVRQLATSLATRLDWLAALAALAAPMTAAMEAALCWERLARHLQQAG
jgi:hypothetical protein